jgi:hypothetical protein
MLPNVFRPSSTKKPLYSTSTVQNQSVARPQQNYSSIMNSMSKAVSPSFSSLQQQNQQRTAAASFQPKKPQSPYASYQPAPKPTPPRSAVASYQPSTPYQASGPDARYASNPSNYSQPHATPAPSQSAPNTPNTQNEYMDSVTASAARQQAFAEEQRKQKENFLRQRYGLANEQLDAAIPQYEDEFNAFKSNTEAGIRDMKASGEMQKGQTKDYYGEAQRQAAKNRTDVRGQTQRTFANLGTLDSRGEGSFAQTTENQDSDFNRFTQQNLKAQADKLTEIDMSVGKAEREASNAIVQEESKMRGLIKQIQLAKSQNRLDEAEQLTQAFNDSQQYIYDIQDGVNNMKYQFAQEKEKLDQALSMQQTETANLSPEFMKTGVPQTMNDFIYRTKNAGAFENKIGAETKSAGNSGKVLGMIDKLLGSDTKPITGLNRIVIPGTSASTTQASWDGLKSLLTLAERGQLKGSGSVSDFETQILEKAAAAGLDPRMDDAAFRARLQEIRNELAAEAGQQTDSSSQMLRVRDRQSGQTGSIPANEFDPQLYERIS